MTGEDDRAGEPRSMTAGDVSGRAAASDEGNGGGDDDNHHGKKFVYDGEDDGDDDTDKTKTKGRS